MTTESSCLSLTTSLNGGAAPTVAGFCSADFHLASDDFRCLPRRGCIHQPRASVAQPWVGERTGLVPRRGSTRMILRFISIPQILLVTFDAVFSQETSKLVLERFVSMVLLLVRDVPPEVIDM